MWYASLSECYPIPKKLYIFGIFCYIWKERMLDSRRASITLKFETVQFDCFYDISSKAKLKLFRNVTGLSKLHKIIVKRNMGIWIIKWMKKKKKWIWSIYKIAKIFPQYYNFVAKISCAITVQKMKSKIDILLSAEIKN